MTTETESILQEAQRLTHGDRAKDYGHPLDDYTRTAALVSALLAHKLSEPISPHEMAMAMICVKLSRQVNHPKRDNMTDAAGYAWVSQECVDEAARRAPLESRGPILGQDFPKFPTVYSQTPGPFQSSDQWPPATEVDAWEYVCFREGCPGHKVSGGHCMNSNPALESAVDGRDYGFRRKAIP